MATASSWKHWPARPVVNAGQTVAVAHAGSRGAVIQLPETLRPAIGSVGQATPFGKEGVSAPATLRQLSDTADRLTRTFEARYVLEGELANAPLGTTVTIKLPDGHPSAPSGAGADRRAVRCGQRTRCVVVNGEPAKVSGDRFRSRS
jgi:hypothetical protein